MICIKNDTPNELNAIDDVSKQFIIAEILFVFLYLNHEIYEMILLKKPRV